MLKYQHYKTTEEFSVLVKLYRIVLLDNLGCGGYLALELHLVFRDIFHFLFS